MDKGLVLHGVPVYLSAYASVPTETVDDLDLSVMLRELIKH